MKILLVEDDLLFAEMMMNALRRTNHQVTCARDGVEGVAKAQLEQFDLIVTDIVMPDKEGIEIIHEMKLAQPDIKIIAISSDAVAGHSSLLKVAEASGADASLRKPFSASELLGKIDELTNASLRKEKKTIQS